MHARAKTRMTQAGMLLLWGSATMTACAKPPPPPPPPPPKIVAPPPPTREPIDNGSECTKTEALCDGGLCDLFVVNDCDKPVTCELTMATSCEHGTSMIEAAGRGRGTVPAKGEDKIQAVGDCQGGRVLATRAKQVSCQ